MKNNKKVIRSLSLITAISLLSSNFAFASAIEKDETVYINLNNRGKVEEKISSVRLHSEGNLKGVKDKTDLKNVENVKTDDKPEMLNGELVWNVDDKNVYYQGEVSKDLPISADIKYFFEGSEVNPEDIAGKDGNLTIKIAIKNNDKRNLKLKSGKTREGYAPYMVATVVDLPSENFSDIKIDNGKLVDDGSNQVVTFVSFPGMKDTLNLKKDIIDLKDEITIDTRVSNFEMKPILVTATTELPDLDALDDAGSLDELLDGLEKIEDASNKLADATEKLSNGQAEFNNGLVQYIDGVGKLNTGSNKLYSGSNELKEGLGQSLSGSKKINEGAKELSSKGKELGNGVGKLGAGTVQYSQKAQEFSKGAGKISEGVKAIPESTKALNNGMTEVMQGTDKVKAGQDELTKGLNKSSEAIVKIKKGKEEEKKFINVLIGTLDKLDAIANALGENPLSKGLKEVVSGQRQVLQGLNSSSQQLIDGLQEVEDGLNQAKSVSGQLSEGLTGVQKGQGQISGGLSQLEEGTKGLAGASQQLEEGSKGLGQGADLLNKNAQVAKEGADKFSKGAGQLSQGTSALTSGLGQLNDGAGQLNKGLAELNSGAGQLDANSGKLSNASNQLADGSRELNKGMNKFNEEAIGKIKEKLDGSDVDISTALEVKDSLVDIAKENTSFSGRSKDMDGSLKFIMRTDGVKAKEPEKKIEVQEEKHDAKGFFNWLKNIFKK